MRNHPLGNVANEGLYTVFEKGMEMINKIWKLTLNNIEKCKDCELRYSCADCRALEERLTKKIDGKATCSYNPSEGKWSQSDHLE